MTSPSPLPEWGQLLLQYASMKGRQKQSQRDEMVSGKFGGGMQNVELDKFLENYINSDLLYRMTMPHYGPSIALTPKPQIAILKHAFANPTELQVLPRPSLCLNTTQNRQTHNKTLFDTFNNTDLSQNQEEEYSNYLREYQTLMKGSRKKEQSSPEERSQEMDKLIHQFLGDISQEHTHPNTTQTTHRKTEQPKTTITRGVADKIDKIEIDLNAFHIRKSPIKSPPVKSPRATNKPSLQKMKKEVTPRFINANEVSAKMKQNKEGREKSGPKKQIQVIKITNLGVKLINNHKQTFQRNIHKVTIAKNPQQITSKRQERPIEPKRQEVTYDNSEYSYSRNRAVRQQAKATTSNNSSRAIQRKDIPENSRKPLKIQIEIPADQLKTAQKETSISREELDLEGELIIKDISQKVLTLLQKSKQLAYQGR